VATSSPQAIPHVVRRLVIPMNSTYDEAVSRYEQLVPAMDAARVEQLKMQGASWDAFLQQAAENAPLGFMIYWKADVTSTMTQAGDRWQCVEYLMGNHTIAERMFRHDPSAMLYAPLRTAIYVDAGGRTQFAVDQPSTRFDSFGNPAIAEVGRELDHKLAGLLEALGAPVPSELR
jgi:Domain of unknown function DUF302